MQWYLKYPVNLHNLYASIPPPSSDPVPFTLRLLCFLALNLEAWLMVWSSSSRLMSRKIISPVCAMSLWKTLRRSLERFPLAAVGEVTQPHLSGTAWAQLYKVCWQPWLHSSLTECSMLELAGAWDTPLFSPRIWSCCFHSELSCSSPELCADCLTLFSCLNTAAKAYGKADGCWCPANLQEGQPEHFHKCQRLPQHGSAPGWWRHDSGHHLPLKQNQDAAPSMNANTATTNPHRG